MKRSRVGCDPQAPVRPAPRDTPEAVDDPCFGKLARANAFGGDQTVAFRAVAIGGPENIDMNQELHCRQYCGSVPPECAIETDA